MALARLPDHQQARSTLERAINVAEQAGDLESAGQAALTLIEQLGHHLSNDDVCEVLKRASALLEKTQDMNTLRRLLACAFRGFFLIQAFPEPPDWTAFEFKQAVRRFEAGLIKRALQEAGGSVTRAAHLLGFGHHQTLVSLLNSRHKSLLNARRPAVPRKRRLTSAQGAARVPDQREQKGARTIRILHVEDNEAVAGTVKEVLKQEGWDVETCADGTAAMGKIASDARYDLLLLDCDLPGVNGMQLVQHARSLAHRRQTPIVILSAAIDEATARLAGANGFLRKPEDMGKITETVTRLLRPAKD
jgi:CheY-like chemotaxis protein